MELRDFHKIPEQETSNKIDMDEINNHIPITNDSIDIEINSNVINSNFLNYYQPYKRFGILFCKIGNTIAFGFDGNFNPKFIIGPHWPLFILMNLILIILTIFLMKTFFNYFGTTIHKIIFIILIIITIIIYYITFSINPGIVLNKQRDMENQSYCDKCQVYFNPNNKVSHCNLCGVCVEGIDHHCVWVGKCVGKKNIKTFYGLLISVGSIYTLLIITVFQIFFSEE
jgi:palmitoyltransferase ZDHHC9/14/18/palmitoyltransferase